MCLCKYVYIYIYIYRHKHTHRHTDAYIYAYTRLQTHMYALPHICALKQIPTHTMYYSHLKQPNVALVTGQYLILSKFKCHPTECTGKSLFQTLYRSKEVKVWWSVMFLSSHTSHVLYWRDILTTYPPVLRYNISSLNSSVCQYAFIRIK